MDGRTTGEKDRITFEEAGVPIPIIHEDFGLNFRTLEASRTTGEPLDTTSISTAGTEVMEEIERMIFNGANIKVGNDRIYGLVTHPERNTFNIGDWSTASTEQQRKDVVSETNAMIKAARADNFNGPFTLYVAKNIWDTLQDDYNDQKGDRYDYGTHFALSRYRNGASW